MKEIPLDEVKRRLLNILSEFEKYCSSNNLKYTLSGGTLLGAVRHKGFIPWDDDIDVGMPREDFIKFSNTYKSKRFGIIYINRKKHHYRTYIKMFDKGSYSMLFNKKNYGIHIDVFPYDRIKNDANYFVEFSKINSLCWDLSHNFKYKHIGINHYKHCFCPHLRWIASNIYNFIVFKYNYFKKTHLVSKSKQHYIYKKYYGNDGYTHSEGMKKFIIFPIDTFVKQTKVRFEGRDYNCYYNYDNFLKLRFGNCYMTPIKENNNNWKTSHGYVYYFK